MGVTVLVISAAAYPFVNLMPQAAFVGMMWVIVYYTFEWKSLPIVWHAFTGMQVRAGRGFLMPCFSSSPSAAASRLTGEGSRRWCLVVGIRRLGNHSRVGWMACVRQIGVE